MYTKIESILKLIISLSNLTYFCHFCILINKLIIELNFKIILNQVRKIRSEYLKMNKIVSQRKHLYDILL